MTVTLFTFGFHKGTPTLYDAMFDCRGIYNPARKNPLLPDGRDPDVQLEITRRDPKARAIIRSVVELARLHPNAMVAIGCRYGKHRSVAIAERIKRGASAFTDINGEKLEVDLYHLDLDEEDYTAQKALEERIEEFMPSLP